MTAKQKEVQVIEAYRGVLDDILETPRVSKKEDRLLADGWKKIGDGTKAIKPNRSGLDGHTDYLWIIVLNENELYCKEVHVEGQVKFAVRRKSGGRGCPATYSAAVETAGDVYYRK